MLDIGNVFGVEGSSTLAPPQKFNIFLGYVKANGLPCIITVLSQQFIRRRQTDEMYYKK